MVISRKTGGIGDVLMTLPTVRAIKQKYKGKVDYATDKKYLNGALFKVLQGNPYIDNVIDWHDLNQQDYHACIELTCPCVIHEQPQARPINRIDIFARHAGVQLSDFAIDYKVFQQEKDWADKYLKDNHLANKRLLMVQAFSSTSQRDLPAFLMHKTLAAILTKHRDVRVIIVTHDTDPKKLEWKYMEIHEARNLDIRQIGALMDRCELVMCPDSAILHLAGALRKRSLSFFGPTDPRARINHYPGSVAIWPAQKLACAPCWYSKRDNCDFFCWKMVKDNMIISTACDMLEQKVVVANDFLVTYDDLVRKQPTQAAHSPHELI